MPQKCVTVCLYICIPLPQTSSVASSWILKCAGYTFKYVLHANVYSGIPFFCFLQKKNNILIENKDFCSFQCFVPKICAKASGS